jgi:hypothetical protein
MEVVDAGLLGLRSAISQLVKRGTPLRFTIYPMIHLAEASFYAEISRRLRSHDLIVAEGISGEDKSGHTALHSFRPAVAARLGLVLQTRELVEVGVPVLWPDMPGAEFGRRWRKLPLAERIIATTAGPVVGMYMRTFGTREQLAGHLATDDDIDLDEWNPELGLNRLIRDDRDALLIEAVTKIHAERQNERIDVAVVYGAGHVPPLVTYLMAALDYVVTGAEWVTVFDY